MRSICSPNLNIKECARAYLNAHRNMLIVTANAVFKKIGRVASEEATVQLIN